MFITYSASIQPFGKFDVNVADIPIVLDYVRCNSGSETSLLDCEHNPFTQHRCVHYWDIVLECTGMKQLL